ncbi:CAMK family protein kinase [Tritrichomonas foetus]|uniref:CAMK family protein kinase n=1 Tax=Tritrichomonas foetus TaxID=1144522 RepID=A0A1J4KYV4_9EUKA|nr:CAMK family protein kinase [Tritrichomonas foetus]|eukprot:OHT16338.1 CAMK family protein kinase [Tritrichomonas foetus]
MQRSHSSLIKRKEGKPNTISEFNLEAVNYITKVLQDRDYEVIERLGLGGFSMIYKVKSLRNNNHYAAKVICISSARHANCLSTYKNEKKALSRVYHANIIKMAEAFESGKFCFLILELCGSQSLNDVIKKGTATIPEKISYMRQLLHAIIHVHSCGYAHRDIKPANVLFDDFGRVKLADFGMCVRFQLGQKSSEYLGSPHYMAPEIYKRQPFDPFAADIWALGVTFYLLCGGKVNWPQNIELLSRMIREEGIVVHRGLQPEISSMVLQMTQMDPEQRPNLAKILKQPIFNTTMEKSHSLSRYNSTSSKNLNLIKNLQPNKKNSTSNLISGKKKSYKHSQRKKTQKKTPHSPSNPNLAAAGGSAQKSKPTARHRRQRSVTPRAPDFHILKSS